MENSILTEYSDKILTITLNRPLLLTFFSENKTKKHKNKKNVTDQMP